MTESSHAVFLSYASQDQEAAERICGALRAAGIEVWFDQSELRGGDGSLRQVHLAQHCFIAIISAQSCKQAFPAKLGRATVTAPSRNRLIPSDGVYRFGQRRILRGDCGC